MTASLLAGASGYSNTALLVPPRTMAQRNNSISGCTGQGLLRFWRDLMQELAVDVEERRSVCFNMDYMRVPQLVVEGLSHVRSPNQPTDVSVVDANAVWE
jgi:hypothetical protein